MNRLFRYMALAISVVFVSSCEGIMSQSSPSAKDPSEVFSEYALALSAFDGIWEALLDPQCYSLRYKCFYGANTDIEVNLSLDVSNNAQQRYDSTPTHDRLNARSESFSMLYKAIERANLVIDGLKKYGNIENDESMRILYAQALTLRAHIYCDLTRAWGDVPARFVPVLQDEFYKPKVNRDVIFKQVLSDLDIAIPILPYPGEHEMTSDAYHINRIYAAGLFARIALMAAGYAQRPDDDKIGTGDLGEIRLSSDPEMSKAVLYPRAIEHLENVISDQKMTLAPDFKEYWAAFNRGELAWSPKEETVLVLPYKAAGRWNYSFAVKTSEAVFGNITSTFSPITGPAPTFYFDYDSNDSRRDVTCFNFYASKNKAIMAKGGQWYFGKFRMDQMTSPPRKGTNNDSAKPVAMRYSDILLMAAEIENELEHLDQAKRYMLPVRARAFSQAEAESYLAGIGDKEAFFNAIVDERAFEFCGEQIRKADLIRWNLLKARMDSTKVKMYELRNLSGRYSWMGKKIYYKQNPDDIWELIIYGYNRGETSDPGTGWSVMNNPLAQYDDTVAGEISQLTQTKIESIYINNPDTKQFWPIPATAITNSQGTLVNDYGY